MTDIIGAAETAISPYTIWIKVALFALAAIALVSGGAYGGYRWELGAYQKEVAAVAQAAVKAQQMQTKIVQKQDAVSVTAATTEANAQAKIVTRTVTLTKEIDHDVPVTTACIPVGLVRLLNGAAAGTDSPDTAYAPGQSDDACSPVSWRDFASDIIDDYGAGNANAEQLTALQAWVKNEASADEVSP